MKNRPIISFLTFSIYTSPESVTRLLETHHKTWSSRFDHWSLQSTQKRLEGGYWNMFVWTHFVSVAAVLFLITILIGVGTGIQQWQLNAGLLVVLVVLYQVLKTVLYKPRYELHFLPLLHNAMQQLTAGANAAMSKAKQQQYHTFTLLLIQYIFQSLSGCSKISKGKIQRELLCRQYGISKEALDEPLDALLQKPYSEQGKRKQTQIMDDFGQARDYFDALGSQPAKDLLEALKMELLSGKK